MYGSGASLSAGRDRVSPTSMSTGIITEETKSFSADANSATGTSVLAGGSGGSWSRSAARCCSRHSALWGIPLIRIPGF